MDYPFSNDTKKAFMQAYNDSNSINALYSTQQQMSLPIYTSQPFAVPSPVTVSPNAPKEHILTVYYLDGTVESFNWRDLDDNHWNDTCITMFDKKNNAYVQIQLSAVKKVERVEIDSKSLPDFEPDTRLIKTEVKEDESGNSEA